eukprot:gene53935-25867_t
MLPEQCRNPAAAALAGTRSAAGGTGAAGGYDNLYLLSAGLSAPALAWGDACSLVVQLLVGGDAHAPLLPDAGVVNGDGGSSDAGVVNGDGGSSDAGVVNGDGGSSDAGVVNGDAPPEWVAGGKRGTLLLFDDHDDAVYIAARDLPQLSVVDGSGEELECTRDNCPVDAQPCPVWASPAADRRVGCVDKGDVVTAAQPADGAWAAAEQYDLAGDARRYTLRIAVAAYLRQHNVRCVKGAFLRALADGSADLPATPAGLPRS